MANKPIRIILVDDHKLTRKSWKAILEYDSRFTIINECDNRIDAINQAGELMPDVIMIDLNMHPVNGFDITQNILKTNPSIKIIGISVNNQPFYAKRMQEIGGSGFITKGSPFDEVMNAIEEVLNGEFFICNETKKLIS